MSAADLLPYLLKVNGALLLFCAVYYLGLRRLTFFGLNRAFLLFALVFAPAYPFIDLSPWFDRQNPLPAQLLLLAPNWQAFPAAVPATINWLVVAYWAGVSGLAVRLVLQLLSLYRLHRISRPAEFEGRQFRAVPEPIAPFAFWQTVYLNPDQHTPQELPAIMCHEQVHVREWHTVDVLLAQLSLLFYWFNPGVWLLRQALHENLEFNTDYRVLQSGLLDNKTYQYQLLHQSVQGQANSIVSHFNFHLLKTRIIMMNKPRTARPQAARYLLLLPLAAGLTLWSCEKKAYLPEPSTTNANTKAEQDNTLYFVNGVRVTKEAAMEMSPTRIASVNVLKGRKFREGFNQAAFEQDFGHNNGPIMLLITKGNENSSELLAFNKKYNITYRIPTAQEKEAANQRIKESYVLVNGQESSEDVTKMDPATIESMTVLDAEQATAKYGEKGKKGAILITTK
ncbi:M56 family metallopeptidase [Hymenobacter wooponensis]|uniref:M56 family peptidase n=1 Tax=Hymenobacter wooponensis TaxID=1525360 RepID=A0A4Z0MDJ6_9BACT|nr:M56 family metallopeptidase [Hymenobacter wooponensis]TGD77832.1 M56 family peptidase [Hymenobacter wooponensis]